MKSAVKTALVLGAMLTPALATAAWDAVVDWAQQTELSTATSGVVASVSVRAGQRVEKGALLLQLEQRALRTAVEQGKAEQEYASLLRDEAARELERAEELYARTLLADHDLNVAKIDYAKANAAYQRSRAQYQEALQALRHSELRAPFDARVLARKVEPSQTVVSQLRAEPLLIIAAADKRVARFAVSASELEGMTAGKRVSVELDGKRHQGVVQSLSLLPSDSGEYLVEVEFETAQAAMPGSRATVTLP